MAIDDKRRDYRYEIYTSRNDYGFEAGSDSIQEIQDFINNWESALQDQAFYERKAEEDAKMAQIADALAKETERLLAITQKILEEKGPEKLTELVKEMEGKEDSV